MSQANLEILIEAIDHFSKPAKQIASVSEKMAKKIQAGQKALSSLKGQQEALWSYQKLEDQLQQIASQFEQARQKTAQLGLQLAKTKQPSQQLKTAFEQNRLIADGLKTKHYQQKQALGQLSAQLKKCGLDTKNFTNAQAQLQQKTQKTIQKMETLKQKAHQATSSKGHQSLQNAANYFLIGGEIKKFGQQTLGLLVSPLNQMRTTERAKGELATLGIDSAGIDLIGLRGEEMSKKLAYLSKTDFLSASYDIKSGIASLDDQGVADMTALAATTARATKGDFGQMTSLFASGYGTFKESLYANLSDKEFGGVFSAAFSKSVQQFKTDGSKMQQAIQSMGSGLAASELSMTDQFTALGMLQQKNDAADAGTIMKALGASAAGAQARFEKMGMNIETLDEQGNLKSLSKLLEHMQAEFGEAYTTETGAKIKEAFGSQEAVGFFESLWGQQEAFRKNAKALKEATQQGGAFAQEMAQQRDNNMDARMQKLGQRWDLVLEKIGYALVPALERLIPWLEKGADWLGKFMEGNSGWVTVIAGVVGGFGLLATAIAPLIVSFGVVQNTLNSFGKALKKADLRQRLGSRRDGDSPMGKSQKSGSSPRSFKGFLKQTWKLLKGKLGIAGALMGGASLASTVLDDSLSKTEKIKQASGQGGSIAGSMLGSALLGAAAGSVFPGIGTLAGLGVGLAGGMLGGWLGGMGGDALGEKLSQPSNSKEGSANLAQTPTTPKKDSLSTQVKQLAGNPEATLATLTPPTQAVKQIKQASQAAGVQIEKIELNLGGLHVSETSGKIDTQALIHELEPQLRQVIERTFQDIQRTQANLSFSDEGAF